MKLLRIVGPSDAGKTTLVERLVGRLSERGRVGTIKHIACDPEIDTAGTDTARHRAAGAVRTYGIDDGGWFATGDGVGLWDALDELAPACEYALIEGYGGAGADLPTVALGGADATDPLVAAPDAEAVDEAALLEAISAVEDYETLGSLVARAKRSPAAEYAGAIATFTGRVRTRDAPDDEPTERLEFEKYEGVAEERLAAIRESLTAREDVVEVLLHHRTGIVEAGEDIVFVVVLAGHRPAAFRAVEDGIDRLKEEVPLFKKEVTVADESWAHRD